MRLAPNNLIYYAPMGVRVGRQASPVFSTTAVANDKSIQIAPREYQKLDFLCNSEFFNF